MSELFIANKISEKDGVVTVDITGNGHNKAPFNKETALAMLALQRQILAT